MRKYRIVEERKQVHRAPQSCLTTNTPYTLMHLIMVEGTLLVLAAREHTLLCNWRLIADTEGQTFYPHKLTCGGGNLRRKRRRQI